ncbi:MAG: FtsX-like permease family protein [Lachnospiraceae bacterium]|nr:FtsX-like permease family protein [Lachnospiraceae bacterium]
MEIRKTLNRFLSIFFIVAMGVAFYSGIQSSAPDMRATGDAYYDGTNLMDIRVVGTMGLTERDLEALEAVKGVERAEPGYMTDILTGEGENQRVLHVEAFQDTLNQVVVTEGRLPQKSGECFLDGDFMDKAGYQLGDRIELIPEEDGSLLKTAVYTITGRGNSPAYLSYNRGSTSLGNGEVSGFMYILPEDFDSEVYTVAYLTVEGARELTAYTREYNDLVAQVLERVEEIQDVRCDARYQEVRQEADEKLEDYRQQLVDGQAELEQARADLESGKAEAESELENARQELESGRAELEDGKQQLAASRRDLRDARAQVEDGESQLADQEAQLASGRQQLAAGETSIASAESELRQRQAQYDAAAPEARSRLETGQSELDAAREQLNSGQAELDARSSELAAAEQASSEAAETLESSRQEYQAGSAALEEAETAYASQRAELDAAWTQYNTGYAAYQEQRQAYDNSAETLNAMEAEYTAALNQAGESQNTIETLTAENEGLQSQIASLEASLGGLQGEIAGLEGQIAEANARLEGLEDGDEKNQLMEYISGLEGQKAEKVSQRDSVSASVSGCNEQIAANNGSLDAARAVLEAANAAVSGLEAFISQLSAALESQRPQLEAAEAQLAATKTELDTNTAALDAAREQLDGQKTELDAAAAMISEGEAQLAQSQSAIESGRSQLAQSQEALESGRQELERNQAEIDAGYQQLAEGSAQLQQGWDQLNSSRQQLEASRSQLAGGESLLEQGRQTLEDSRTRIREGEQEIENARSEIDENERTIRNGWEDYEDGKQEAQEEIADGEQKILDAEEELKDAGKKLEDAQKTVDELETPKWYVTDRSGLTEYSGYGENAERMTNIGRVFPVLFFLVAALISLTTMTRMVEEERVQTGTLKALGYGKRDIAAKYLKYALYATLGGGITGILIGEKILPYVIIYAYGMMYNHMPEIVIPYQWSYGLIAIGVALVCTLGAAYSASSRALKDTPAKLMRPQAPREGKRVWLEYLPFLWKRLSFTWKSTVRNLFRYKKRFWMTVIGISGCMGLMVVGFGLSDSIMDIAKIQYSQLQYHDMMVIENPDAEDEKREELYEYLDQDAQTEAWKRLYAKKVTVRTEEKTLTPYLYVPEDKRNLEDFMIFRDRNSKEEYELTDEGAIITEKLASMLGLKPGDSITMEDDDAGEIQIPITQVTENYLYHYIYLTPACYERFFKDPVEFNSILVNTVTQDQAEIQELGGRILQLDGALNVTYTGTIENQLEDMLSSLDIIVAVLVISAGMLAFVVLYNLNNININERKRELATIKVLGFYDAEVDAYVYRENILLTVIGAAAGVALGILLHRFIITTVEVDACMFGRNINTISFVYSVLLTFLFSMTVNGVMHFKLKKIDMIESLKSVE